MGFYMRKSVKFGAMRVNFSKSGVGFSTGVKGLRVGTGPRGNYVHIGRGGYYYRKTFSHNKRTSKNNLHNKSVNTEASNYDFEDIKNQEVTQLTDSSHTELLEEIQKKYKSISFYKVWITLSFLLTFMDPSLFSLILLTPLIWLLDNRRKTVLLIYDIDDEHEQKLQQFYDSFGAIMKSRKKWHVYSEARLNTTHDKKINAGAGQLIKRKDLKIKECAPPKFKTNVKVPGFSVGKQQMYFLPDKLLIYDKKKVACVDYDKLSVHSSNIRFIETGGVPRDSRQVDTTWKYVNKKGGPDKRYKDNRQLPVMEYSEINFSSNSGMNTTIQTSAPDLGHEIREAINMTFS